MKKNWMSADENLPPGNFHMCGCGEGIAWQGRHNVFVAKVLKHNVVASWLLCSCKYQGTKPWRRDRTGKSEIWSSFVIDHGSLGSSGPQAKETRDGTVEIITQRVFLSLVITWRPNTPSRLLCLTDHMSCRLVSLLMMPFIHMLHSLTLITSRSTSQLYLPCLPSPYSTPGSRLSVSGKSMLGINRTVFTVRSNWQQQNMTISDSFVGNGWMVSNGWKR